MNEGKGRGREKREAVVGKWEKAGGYRLRLTHHGGWGKGEGRGVWEGKREHGKLTIHQRVAGVASAYLEDPRPSWMSGTRAMDY